MHKEIAGTVKPNAVDSNGAQLNGTHQEDLGLNLGAAIRNLREQQGKKAVDLAKSSGIDPRTVTAIEKGRIKNPSLHNLICIAKALQLTPADFFYEAELERGESVHVGDQKGEFSINLASKHARVISFVPAVRDFFIGKIVMEPQAVLGADVLPAKGRVFLQVILGKLDVTLGQRNFLLKEGDHFLINGRFPHAFLNPLMRESSFLLVTVPSFLSAA